MEAWRWQEAKKMQDCTMLESSMLLRGERVKSQKMANYSWGVLLSSMYTKFLNDDSFYILPWLYSLCVLSRISSSMTTNVKFWTVCTYLQIAYVRTSQSTPPSWHELSCHARVSSSNLLWRPGNLQHFESWWIYWNLIKSIHSFVHSFVLYLEIAVATYEF